MKILPGHGSGGKLMNELIEKTIRGRFSASVQLDDAALLAIGGATVAFTTDSFTITPIFFPGGDIGALAVNGTVNDLAVMGAEPKYLSCSLIIEEGMELADLERVLDSMRAAADAAGVSIVTGDTKVVPHGAADRLFINTSGIGIVKKTPARREISAGDAIVINGHIGDHGMTIMAARSNLGIATGLASDCAALNRMIGAVMERYADSVKFMRDATRGGVASVLNEIVKGMPYGALLHEPSLPIRDEVRSVCGILGIDALYAANEGKVVMVAGKEAAESIVSIMREFPEGDGARVIGSIDATHPGKAYLETAIGGRRILPLLVEEQLPRIC